MTRPFSGFDFIMELERKGAKINFHYKEIGNLKFKVEDGNVYWIIEGSIPINENNKGIVAETILKKAVAANHVPCKWWEGHVYD